MMNPGAGKVLLTSRRQIAPKATSEPFAVTRKSARKPRRADPDSEAELPRLGVRTVLFGGAFAIMAAIVLYNALALQPPLKTADREIDAGSFGQQTATVLLHYDPVVEDLQRQLLALGRYNGMVDGIVGDKTRAAITAYQQSSGLLADGNPSQELLDRIKLERKIAAAAQFTASTGQAEESRNAVSPVSNRVYIVQRALVDLGYDPGEPDGRMTGATRAAIRRLETDRHLSVTGEINAAVLAELSKTTGYENISNQ